MAERLHGRQDDNRAAPSRDPPLRHHRDRTRQLALQKPNRRSDSNPRSRRLRNLAFIPTLMDSTVELLAADNPHANRLPADIPGAVAEHERAAISERTKAALAAAKRRGVKLGGPRLAAARKASNKARSEAADAFAANVRPIQRS